MPYGDVASRNRALAANLGGGPTPPAYLYAALLRQAGGDLETTPGVEPSSAGGYARVGFVNNPAAWQIKDATATNLGELRWPTSTDLYSITDPLNQWALFDNATGGALVAFGVLYTPVTVTGVGDTPVIPAGGLLLVQEP